MTKPAPDRPGGPARRELLGAALLLAIGAGAGAPARAQPPQLRQLSLQRTTDGLLLAARIALDPTPGVQDALHRGVPLYFVWQAEVYRRRWYWTDRRVASAVRILRLAYQPLTRLWRVSLSTDLAAASGSGLQYALHQNFDTLPAALAAIGRVTRWRLADAAALEPEATHYVDVAFRLDLSLLPRPLQIGMGNQPEWTVGLEQQLRVPDSAAPERPFEPRDTDAPSGVEAGATLGDADEPAGR